jgi:hypothetical protein
MQNSETTVSIKSSGNVTQVHHFTLTSKQPTMEWKHPGSPRKKKFTVTPCGGKVLAAAFLESPGVLMVKFLNMAAQLLLTGQCSRQAISSICLGLLGEGVILLHDNSWLHTEQQTWNPLQNFAWEMNYPPFWVDLALSDFHLLSILKEHVSELCFTCDNAIKHATIM